MYGGLKNLILLLVLIDLGRVNKFIYILYVYF